MPSSRHRTLRIERLVEGCIRDFSLDLEGISVFTEAASGAYLHTPILAAVAGARRVYALTRSSKYGDREDIRAWTLKAAEEWGVADRIQVLFEKSHEALGDADIITNSGFVRPLNRPTLEHLKPTAVISLMWEPWEFREDELDLAYCKEKGLLVLGTDEHSPPLDLVPVGGFLAMKLLFHLGLEGFKTRTLLLGGGHLGRSIFDHFASLNLDVAWFSEEGSPGRPYSDLPEFFAAHGGDFDAVVVAEHSLDRRLLGERGLLSYTEIGGRNPALAIGIISGNIDREGLAQSGLAFYPKEIMPFGYMSYQPYDLGPRPILELYAAGLLVGQVMSRARLGGMSVRDAARHTIANAPAMDFEGSNRWS